MQSQSRQRGRRVDARLRELRGGGESDEGADGARGMGPRGADAEPRLGRGGEHALHLHLARQRLPDCRACCAAQAERALAAALRGGGAVMAVAHAAGRVGVAWVDPARRELRVGEFEEGAGAGAAEAALAAANAGAGCAGAGEDGMEDAAPGSDLGKEPGAHTYRAPKSPPLVA